MKTRFSMAPPSGANIDNPQANTARLVNCYREPANGKAVHVIQAMPGTTLFADLATLFVRDMARVGDDLYALAGTSLFRVLRSGLFTEIASVASAATGQVFGVEAGSIGLVADQRFYVWDGSSLTEPTLGAFSAVGKGVFYRGYTILPEHEGRRFMWSNVGDSTTWDGADVASAESTDSDILRIMSTQDRIFVMKEDVIESWYQTGDAGTAAFARLPGGVEEVGLKSADLVTRLTGGLFFVGADGIVYIMAGGPPAPISTPHIHAKLAQKTPLQCFSFEERGHKFCVIRYTDAAADVYDFSTREWVERETYGRDDWAIVGAVEAFGGWFGADQDGKIYRFERVRSDAGGPLVRKVISSTLYQAGNSFSIAELEITGGMSDEPPAQDEIWSINTTDGRRFYHGDDDLVIPDSASWNVQHEYTRESSVMLRVSRDSGTTWTPGRLVSFASPNGRNLRAKTYNLGYFDDRATIELRMATTRDIILDAELNMRVT